MMMISMLNGLHGREDRDTGSSLPQPLTLGLHGDRDTMTSHQNYSPRIPRGWPAYRSSPEHPLQPSTVPQVTPCPALATGRFLSEEQPADNCHQLLNIHPL